MEKLVDEYLGWLALGGSFRYLELTELSGKSFARWGFFLVLS